MLIGVQPSAAFPALPVAGAHVEADVLTELADFRFEERAALITRSQVEGSDVLLPKRFVRVRFHDTLVLPLARVEQAVAVCDPACMDGELWDVRRATSGTTQRGGRSTPATLPPATRTACAAR